MATVAGITYDDVLGWLADNGHEVDKQHLVVHSWRLRQYGVLEDTQANLGTVRIFTAEEALLVMLAWLAKASVTNRYARRAVYVALRNMVADSTGSDDVAGVDIVIQKADRRSYTATARWVGYEEPFYSTSLFVPVSLPEGL